jgi:hypothetical protein
MNLKARLTVALNETRMLMMGAQILFGFQFQGVFQPLTERASGTAHALQALGLVLMASCLTLLIAVPSYHRLGERGEATGRMVGLVTALTGWALLPLGLALGADIAIVLERPLGLGLAAGIATVMVILAFIAWHAGGFALRQVRNKEVRPVKPSAIEKTDLATRINQMLTEARVILPGAQAMLGFQFIVMLTPAFDRLDDATKLVHIAALILGLSTVILLMAPAAIHRIAFAGDSVEQMLRIGSMLISLALLPLSVAMSADIYVAVGHVTESPALGAAAGIVVLIAQLLVWYVWPLGVPRKRRLHAHGHSGAARG